MEKLKKMQDNQKFKRLFFIEKVTLEQREQYLAD